MTKEMMKRYDFHIQFENELDDEPRVYAYRMYYDKDGLLYSDTHPSSSYYFTDDETQQALEIFKKSDSGIDELADLYWDEWFTTEDEWMLKTGLLSDKAIDWINTLPEYEIERL